MHWFAFGHEFCVLFSSVGLSCFCLFAFPLFVLKHEVVSPCGEQALIIALWSLESFRTPLTEFGRFCHSLLFCYETLLCILNFGYVFILTVSVKCLSSHHFRDIHPWGPWNVFILTVSVKCLSSHHFCDVRPWRPLLGQLSTFVRPSTFVMSAHALTCSLRHEVRDFYLCLSVLCTNLLMYFMCLPPLFCIIDDGKIGHTYGLIAV